MIKFSTNSITSKEEIKKFNYVLLFKNLLLPLILFEICLLVLFFAFKSITYLILFIIYPIILYLVFNFTVNNRIKKEANFTNIESTINFYDDAIEQVNKYANTKIPYKDLYKLIDSKDNYYFLTGPNTGFNVIKANCSPELIDFIEKDLKNIIKH